MKINDSMEFFEVAASRFYGRRPGIIKSNNPSKLLAKAKEIWGDDGSFGVHLSRAIEAECPHMKGATWDTITHTQKRNVARRMQGQASQRLRARKMQGKK